MASTNQQSNQLSSAQQNLPERVPSEQVQEAPITELSLPKGFVRSLSGVTPSVANARILLCKNAGATTVTDLTNGANGQRIHIIGDGNTTISNNAKIKTNTGANKLLTNGLVYRFTCTIIAGTRLWHEDA